MIIFGNAALEDAAPVRVRDITVFMPDMRPIAADRVYPAGQEYAGMRVGARRVVIRFALDAEDMAQRAGHLRAVTQWASGMDIRPLRLPGYDGMHLMAVCTAHPDFDARAWWRDDLRLELTAFDPYWRADAERRAAAGDVFIGGSAPPEMRIEYRNEQAGDCLWSDGIDEMRFSGVPPGLLVIDLNRQTALLDGTGVMDRFDPTGTFPLPRAGRFRLAGPGEIVWRERWL